MMFRGDCRNIAIPLKTLSRRSTRVAAPTHHCYTKKF
jgi:hypothetical protein